MMPDRALNASTRRTIEGLAYRMLGSWSDAQDIAQEALLRWHRLRAEERGAIRQPTAWLSAVATRLCLDLLKSARRQREVYVGPWLPEPMLTHHESPAASAELDDSIHFALILALQRLNPTERAAFLLHDVFGYAFAEVAAVVGKSELACRRAASRARAALREERERFDFDPAAHQRLLHAFLEATDEGDAEQLASLLAEDVVLHSDGGGVVPAARRVLRSRDIVSRLFLGLARKQRRHSAPHELRFLQLNGLPSVLVTRNGTVDTALSLAIADGHIQEIFQQRNPAKLAALAEALDLQGPASGSRKSAAHGLATPG